ncbi:S8 family serine peptidase [Streptomyces sp. R41]|uniref:S8 family serine peptidase n=1 Tax=Streptomyces sp. R41 TaxID=3238632 RepID=A0AB39RBR7_9ACTN
MATVSALVAATLVGLPSAAPSAAVPVQEAAAMGAYVVVLHDSARGQLDAIVKEHRARYGEVTGFVYRHALVGYSARIPNSQVSRLQNDPRVEMVAPDRPVHATQQRLSIGVDRVDGDVSSTRSGNGSGSVDAGVAILDSGIDLDHPDLNVAGGVNCVNRGKPPQDDQGHGTGVAGIVGAKDNDADTVGVAPGARLYAVKVLNTRLAGNDSRIVCGLDWVAQHAQGSNINVVNMSLAGISPDDGNCGRTKRDVLHLAVCKVNEAGVTVVVAAGNDSTDFANTSPANYNEVLTVTAMQDADGQPGGLGTIAPGCQTTVPYDDAATDFSNFTTIGSADAAHTIAAPGLCLRTTALIDGPGGGNVIWFGGTSFSSPHVAGTAALCITTSCAGMTPAQVIAKLRADAAAQPASYGFTGDPHTPIDNRYYGYLDYAGKY